MADIQFKNVYKTYDKTETIQDLNLQIQDKEFLVLVGPSGCGKSTTLRMIAGLEEVSRGDIFVGDRCVTHIAPKERDIAMVFQNYALYPHLNVRENIEFSLKMRKCPKAEIEKQVNEVADILGLKEVLDKKPKQLSGGQRQRVAMGRAIVRQPKVFLFDEPLSNLDAKLRVQMRVELAKLHKKLGTTIVYVTHDQVEAMTLADRIVVMNGGKIQQIGTPLELYNKPTNAFVGAFIGSPAMNQIPAQIREQNGQIFIIGNQVKILISSDFVSNSSLSIGQKIILGIRPEHITPCEKEKAMFSAEIEVIEPMGGESFVYFTLENKEWVCRLEGTPNFKEGEILPMSLSLSNLHLFSEDGSKRVCFCA